MSRLRKIVLAVLTVVLLSVSVLGLMACDGCGDDHEHTAEHVNGVAPTCITTGIQEYWVCTDITCSKMFSDEGCENEIAQAVILPALGHEFLWVEDLAATMYQEGIRHQECSRCQARAEEGTKLAMLTHIHDMQVTENIAATCMTRGHVTQKCTTCGYQTTTFSAALGHLYNIPERVCEQSRYCTRDNCGEVEEELQHDYQEISYQAKDCVHDEETVYECNLCGDTYPQKGEVATGVHTVSGSWSFVREEATSNKCVVNRVESAYCSVCNATVERKQPETKHSEMKYIKTKATCMAEGTYGFKCSVCGETTSDDETYPIDTTAHTWGEPSVSGAVTTYYCTNNGCTETKTVVDKSAEKTATVDADALTSAGGIKLDGAEMKLDSTVASQLGSGNVTISADTVPDKSTLGLDEDKLAQIGDNPVYDFSLTDGTNNIGFNGGSITITLPYELDADESVDGISVWYINSNGGVEEKPATYFEDANGNGFVTFTTTHFSYYTVTRLTPAERCAKYGHSNKQRVIPATCTSDGYTITICLRCGAESEKTAIIPATGHSVVQNGATVQPTCTAYGYTNYKCEKENCNYAYQKRIPATGHNLVKDTVNSITATCTVEGRDVFYCDNDGCSARTSKNLGKKDHNFTTTDIAPTCVEPGKSTHVCKVCAFTYEDGHLNPTGHNYKEEKVEATCTQDGYIMHKCSNTGCTAGYQTGTIKAHHTWNVEEPTCIGQTCIHCGATGLPAVKPHTMGENGICTVCGAGCEHTYVDTVVAPTCTTEGYTLSKCSACGVEKKGTIVKATGHIGTYTCSVCNQSILPENFFINGFESMMEGNLTIRLTDVIIDESTSFNRIFKDSVTVQFAELVLGVDNGKIIGYGGGKLYASFNGDTPITVEIYAVIENDTLYVELKNLPSTRSNGSSYYGESRLSGAASQTVTFTDTYYSMPLSVMLNEMLGFSADDTSVQLVEKLVGWLETDLRPLITTLLNANKAKISEITVAGITELFNFEQQSNGYRISLNYEKLKAFNDKLAENKVSDVIDSIFGAESYANLKTKVLELPDMTVGQLLDKTVEYGLTTDQLLTVVDNLVKIITNGEFETLQALLIDEGVLDDDENINELLNNKRIKKAKLGYLFSEIVGGDEDGLKEELAEVFDKLETRTLYEFIRIDKEEVNEVIEAMQSSFEINAYTATDGKFVEFSVKATELDIDGVKLGFKASILNDASATYDYAQKLQEAKTNVNVLKLTDKNYQKAYNAGAWKQGNYGNYDNKEFIPEFDSNGNLIAWTREYIDEFYADRVIEQTDDYVIFEHCSVYTMSMRVEMKNAETSVTKACGDWWDIHCYVYSGKYFGGYRYTNCVVKQDKSNGAIEVISYGERTDYNRYYKRSDSFRVLYNSKTGEFASINGNDTHTWQLDASQSTAPIGCSGIGKNYYVCTECDEFKIEYLANGHTDVQRTYTLLGEDCSDGVTVTETCLTCGAVEQYTTYNHVYTYEYLDLSGCNGACEEHNRVYISTCPCGEENHVYTGSLWGSGSSDGYGNHYSNAYCEDCAFNVAVKGTTVQNGCSYSEFAVYTFYWGTAKIAEFEMVESHDNHNYAETTYTLLEGATSCSDGVVATSICKRCEKVSVETYYYHDTTRQCIEIKDGDNTVGEVLYYGCLCGERVEGFYVNDCASILDDEENVIKYVFSNGDIVRKEWTERTEGCYVYRDVTVTMPNGTTLSYTENDYKHNMVTTAELINGATSCEDGVRINIKCSECNYYTDNYVAYTHRAVTSEEIDLQLYGATCATGIEVEKCACGQIRGWDFADLDSDACDFDVDVYSSYNSNQDKQVYTYKGVEYTTGMWKYGAWHFKYTEFLEMMDGQHIGDMFYRDNAAVLMTCAVTDPQCTLQIFYGQKYTNANCSEKVDYVLVVFVGGVEKLSYSWTESYSSGHSASAWEFTPDAEGSCYGTYTQKCVTCNHVMYQYKGYEHTVERTWISKCAYTLKCTTCQKKFNSVYYAHNFVDYNEDPCLRDEYCTQCGVQGYSGTDHNIMTDRILVKEATCSQTGIMKYKKWCYDCEEVMLEYEYIIWPNGHYYSHYNSETDMYDCSRCGIENINGADGVIILEDCTENLSTASEIKVGYFIKKFKNNFTQNVSIMVGEEQIVIQDIQIVKEGDSYVKFSKAEVIAWANAHGYEVGTYDIRLSFVPIGNTTNLDYAITFTADELWG